LIQHANIEGKKHRTIGRFGRCCALVLAILFCTDLLATGHDPAGEEKSGWSISGWSLRFSLYTKHFDPDPDHVNRQKLIAPELVFENGYLAGVAVFDNSFGQNSQFVYMGKAWPIFKSKHWYVKLMGGLLHGYKEPYEDKIPLNGLGVAPAILPALGFKYKRVMVEANLAGLAAMTITAGVRF
jgi:hypothetical protein